MAIFTVNTHHAYLNTEIVFTCNGTISVEDTITGEMFSFTNALRTHLKSGRHIFKTDNHEEEIIIEDAIKYGGSSLKTGYIFDDNPWTFIVMKDRMYLENIETKEEKVEYNVTPDEIRSLGMYNGMPNDYYLFRTNHDYSIYNVQLGKITKTFTNHIYSNSIYTIYKEDNFVVIFDYHNNCVLSEFEGQYSFGNKYYFVKDNKLFGLDWSSTKIIEIDFVGKVQHNSILYKNTLLTINGDYYKQKDSFYKAYRLYELGTGEDGMSSTNLLFPYFIDNWFGIKTEEFQHVIEERDEYVEKFQEHLSKNISQVCYGLKFNTLEVILSDNKKELVFKGEIIRSPDFYKFQPKFVLKTQAGLPLNMNNISFYSTDDDKKTSINKTNEDNINIPDGEKLVTASVSRKRVITRKDKSFYFHDYEKGNCSVLFENTFDVSRFSNAYFTSDGKSVVLQISEKEGKLLGIDNLHTTLFEVESFTLAKNEGYNGYKPEVMLSSGRRPVWRDPITLNFISEKDMSSHIFRSPYGEYCADIQMKSVLYNRLTRTEISLKDVEELKSKYNWNSETKEEEKDAIIKLRKELAEQSDKYDLFGKIIDASSRCFSNLEDEKEKEKKREVLTNKWIDQYITKEPNFVALIVDRLGYVFYRKNETGAEEKRILIGRNVYFLNYVSFSYDSKYLSFAAKMKEDEFRSSQEGVFVIFDLKKEEIVRRIERVNNHQLWAVWMTMFSKNGDVAFYDSCANAYLANKDDNFMNIKTSSGKSLLCFSPSGKYIAFSDQNYIDFAHHPNENWGHQPSGNVFIHAVNEFDKCIEQYNDLGDSISGVATRAGNVSSAAFSQDEKRLLVVGSDGVVVVRNLKLGKKDKKCNEKDYDDDEYDSYEDGYGTHYGEFAGTYAQDVMGYSDDVINDAFDGEADAYWNID